MPLDQVDVDQLDSGKKTKEMSFIDHLEELRWTLMRSIIGITVITIVTFIFKDFFIGTLVFGPTKPDFIGYDVVCKLGQLIGTDKICFSNELIIQNPKIIGQFMNHFKVSILLGIILAFPFLFYQVWKFVRPALHNNELKATKGIIFFTWFFFLLGVAFGYVIILPFALQFLTNYVLDTSISNIYLLNDYAAYISMVTLGAGIMFELPVLMFILAKMGLVTPRFLREKRRYAVVIIIIIASIITPPDIGTQMLIGLPVYLLYELSIFVVSWVTKREVQDELV